jgi:hypothetical protein
MKKTMIRVVLAALFLIAPASTSIALADGSVPMPWCCPGCTCN